MISFILTPLHSIRNISIKIVSIIFLSLLVVNCSSTTEISNERTNSVYKESSKNVSNLIIDIPDGWREINDNHDRLFEIWLVNLENNASICFIPININFLADTISLENKIEIAGEILIKDKKSKNEDFEIISESYLNKNRSYKSIYYKIGESFQRSIIFGSNNKVYECLAYGKSGKVYSEVDPIFETQLEIVKYLKIK